MAADTGPIEAADIMARVSPSRVIFVLGWSSVAKDGILRKLTGSAGAQANRTFDTDSLAHRVYAPPEPSDTSFVYVGLSSFAGIPLDDSSSAETLSSSTTSSHTGVLDLARLGSVGGIMLLCGPSITPHDRTLLRFVQAFFGPSSLSKVTVIFNLWDQCRDEAYTSLRARLQGSATDADIAAIRNPPSQFLGGKILTCAPRAAGDERVTNLSPIVRKRYDGLGGQFAKLQFVREIEDGREPGRTEAARVLERGEDGLLKVVDGYARVASGKSQRSARGVSRSNTMTSTTSNATGRRRSVGVASTQKTTTPPTQANKEKDQKSESDEEPSPSPGEFEPPMSPAPAEPVGQPLFPSMVPMPVQAEIEQAAEAETEAPAATEDVKAENGTTDMTTTTTAKDVEQPHSASPTLVDGPASPTAEASAHLQPTEETPLLSRPSTSSSAADSLPSSTISSSAPSTTSSQCLAQTQRRRIKLVPSFKVVRKLLKRPLAVLSDALAKTKKTTAEVVARIRRALWMAFVVVPLVLVRAAFWMTAAVVVRLLMPQREDGPETVISSL